MARLEAVVDKLKDSSTVPEAPLLRDDTHLFQKTATVEVNMSNLLSHQESESLQILTQYIGPPTETKNTGSKAINTTTNTTLSLEQQELNSLKKIFLRETETMDRANSHAESLTRATERGRIPPKLRIDIKPMVINQNDPIFQKEWLEALDISQTTLIDTIKHHLNRTARAANIKIRENTELTRQRLKAQHTEEETTRLLNNTLEEANSIRNKTKEERRKKKLENTQKRSGPPPNKKPKTNNQQ